MTAAPAPAGSNRDDVEVFLNHGLEGEVRQAVGVALRQLDDGAPACSVVDDLLAPAQLEVGERWSRNELSVGDEHLATGSAESALHALAATLPTRETAGHVLLACPPGEWHAAAAHMFSVQLQARGIGVQFLGASTPAQDVATLLGRRRPDAVVISCTMPIFFGGVMQLIQVAHQLGLPVLVGGRAFVDGRDKVRRLGGDAWAPDVGAAVAILEGWRQRPPIVAPVPESSTAAALQLELEADELGAKAFQALAGHRHALPEHEQLGPAPDREQLALIVRFLAAAQLVESDEVFIEFVDWLAAMRTARGLPRAALRTELEVLVPFLGSFPQSYVELLQRGANSLDQAV